MNKVPEIFGSMVFNESVMKARLPKDTFKSLMRTRKAGTPLAPEVANVVANAMKDWAVEHGCTHFTHWFQPMTGVTAEKHDSFIYPIDGERVIMEFSGKELIKGEPDASSFPSGGLRATFEARGYTAWDPTSDAFIKDDTLCIPTAFCSYTGEALDKKTPLLRSMNALNKQALRVLRLFGDFQTQRVHTTVGPEQEYFLIDRDMYLKRRDLVYTGRTLFGAKPPKGQEMEDHYFGVIKPKVKAFMEDLDEELWKLGVLAKTEHNEVAPSQHELAPIFADANVAADHNQLTMEVMKKVAARHGLACLLHEKPFEGVNGSGKHNNWSMSTDRGANLLDPGDSPRENAQFLLFLVAIIEAVDEHQDLLRLSVASAGNDHRLGANEAPPAIISIFLGDELTAVLESIDQGKDYDAKDREVLKIGVDALPPLPKDTTDRNRTSPFAFTGNKFEFRMLGSTVSIACPNMILNTIVADVLESFADRLENAEDFTTELNTILHDSYHKHKRIVFNGDGYTDAWVKEAEKRGLLNLPSTAEALPYYARPENVKMFEHHGVLTGYEVRSRCEIQLENYCKQLHIEALTMVDMLRKQILPAASKYLSVLGSTITTTQAAYPKAKCQYEKDTMEKLSSLIDSLYKETGILETDIANEESKAGDIEKQAHYVRDTLFVQMEKTRAIADQIEPMVDKTLWPYPTYGDMLFSVL